MRTRRHLRTDLSFGHFPLTTTTLKYAGKILLCHTRGPPTAYSSTLTPSTVRGGYLDGEYVDNGRYEWKDTPWKRVECQYGPDRANECGPMGVHLRHPSRSWTAGLKRMPVDPPQAITGKLASRRTVNEFRKGIVFPKKRALLSKNQQLF